MSTTPGRRSRPCVVPAAPYLGAVTPPADADTVADRRSEADAPDTRPSPLCRAARVRRR